MDPEQAYFSEGIAEELRSALSRIGMEVIGRASSAAVKDLDALQTETGTAGEIDVLVEGADLTDPKVVRWMRDYQSSVLLRQGYTAERGCAGATLCPALSLPDLFRTPELSATREQVREIVAESATG